MSQKVTVEMKPKLSPMKALFRAAALSMLPLVTSICAVAEDKIELETTIIKGNTELPKILYVVPWQDVTEDKKTLQKLTLHSLFGDIFEPVTPNAPSYLDK